MAGRVNTYKYLSLLLYPGPSTLTTCVLKLRSSSTVFFTNSLLLRVTFRCTSNLEYARQVWSPYKLEKLIVCALNLGTLTSFSLPDLQQRRLHLDLCTMFRITNGLFSFPNYVFVHQTSSIITHSTSQTLICPFTHTIM